MINAKSNRRILGAFRAVSLRWRSDKLSFCFCQLKDKAHDRGALRNMQLKALMFWMRSMRKKFLLCWWDNVHETRRLTYAMSKDKPLVKGKISLSTSIALRNVKRRVCFAIQYWCGVIKMAKRRGIAGFKNQHCIRRCGREMIQLWHAHIQMQRAAGRFSWKRASSRGMVKRKLSFEEWKRVFACNKSNILRVARVMTRRQLKYTESYWNLWVEMLRRSRQECRLWRSCESKRDACKQADCFWLWRVYATAQKRLVVAAAKVLSRRDFIAIAGYFYWFARLTDKWKRISIWCDKIERSSVRTCFCLWRDERTKWAQKKRKWQYTAFKMMQGLLRRLFEHWRATHIETCLHRCTIKKWATRMGVQVLTVPWLHKWSDLIRQRNSLNRTLRLGQQRSRPIRVAKHLRMWQDRTEYRRMVWSVSRRIKIRWFAMVGTQSFYSWRRYLSNKAKCSALIHHVAVHRLFHFCASFFYVWEEQVNEGKTIALLRFRSEAHERGDQMASLKEQVQAAEHLLHIAAIEKQGLADELEVVREQCATANRVIECLNETEEGSKLRIEKLLSRLDQASNVYDRLEETQSVVKELRNLHRTSTDETNRLQVEWDVCRAEKDGIAHELEQTREKLTLYKQELDKMEERMVASKAQSHDLTAQILRQCHSMETIVDQLDHDLLHTTDKCKSGRVENAASKQDSIELKLRVSELEECIASEKRRILGLILPQDPDAGNKESVLLVLDMQLHDIKANELDFVDEVAAHVSNALNCHDAGWVTVTSLQSGVDTESIKARLWFGPGPSSSGLMPLNASNILKTQAHCEGSILLTGLLGCKVKDVELPALSSQANTSLHDTDQDDAASDTDQYDAHDAEQDDAASDTDHDEVASGISPDGNLVSTISNKSPARVTRGTPMPPTHKQFETLDKLAASPSAASPLKYSGHGDAGMANVTLKLGLDFRVAGRQGSKERATWERNVLHDLAYASGLTPSDFNIKKVSQGSVVVELEIPCSPCVPDPMAVAAHLERQVSDPTSALRSAATTRYTISVHAHYVAGRLLPSSQGSLLKDSKLPTTEEQEYQVSVKDTLVGPNFSASTTQRADAGESLAHERAMRERIYALESLMIEKDGWIQALEEKCKSSEPLRENIRELHHMFEAKNAESRNLQARLEMVEADNSRMSNEADYPSPTATQNNLAEQGLQLTSRNLSSPPSPSGDSSMLVPKVVRGGPVRAVALSGAARSAMMPSHSEQLLQFQSTLCKAEAALAEQSCIVESQAADLIEARKMMECGEIQNKTIQVNLQHVLSQQEENLSDLAHQKEVANSVMAQLHKLSQKNAELTKEVITRRRTSEETSQMNDRLRKELENALNTNALNTQRQSGSVPQTLRGDIVLEIDAQKKLSADLQRQFDDVCQELQHSTEARSIQHETAVLERQKLHKEKKEAVDRQQLVIDRLMHIIDTHRERRNNARDHASDGQIEALKLRASAAERAVQQSISMHQTLQVEIQQQEEDKARLRQALEASMEGNTMEGNTTRAHALINERTEPLVMTEAHEREFNESLTMMRVKTRWECVSRAQEGQLKRRNFKLLDVAFSCWANLTEENQFEKLIGDTSCYDGSGSGTHLHSSLQLDPSVTSSETAGSRKESWSSTTPATPSNVPFSNTGHGPMMSVQNETWDGSCIMARQSLPPVAALSSKAASDSSFVSSSPHKTAIVAEKQTLAPRSALLEHVTLDTQHVTLHTQHATLDTKLQCQTLATTSAPQHVPIKSRAPSAPPSPSIQPDSCTPTPIAPPRRSSAQRTPPSISSRRTSESPPYKPTKALPTSPILTDLEVLLSLDTSMPSRTLDLHREAQTPPASPANSVEMSPVTCESAGTCAAQPAWSLSEETLHLIGLKLAEKGPPYVVEDGKALVDVFGAVQGQPQYSNQFVEQGDTLLFVDGHDVSVLGAQGIVHRLNGQAKSQTHLVFSSRKSSSLYRITVLRLALPPLL